MIKKLLFSIASRLRQDSGLGLSQGVKRAASEWRRSFGVPLVGGLLLSLAACGGGSDPLRPIVAGPDRLSIQLGETGTVLSNDSFDGAAATVGSSGLLRFAVTSGALPPGITVIDGGVRVAGTAVPGSFSFTYSLCEAANPNNCASATSQVVVPPLAIVAAADTLNLASGTSGDVLANDRLGSAAATAATVSVSAATLPTGVQVSSAGLVTVGSAAVPGTYPLPYTICQTAVPTNCATSTLSLTVPPPADGVVAGRAVNASTGVGLAGVLVSVGEQTVTTDAGGNFSLSRVPAGQRIPVQFDAASFAPTVRITSLAASGRADVQARMLPVGTIGSFDVAAGGTVSMPGSPAQVVIPPNGLQRADGTLPIGSVTVILTPIDPAADASVMPGDFTTLAAGVETLIESFGAVNVRVRDSGGASLELRAGLVATLRIPLRTRSAAVPASMPLFRFDGPAGRWVQEGTATRSGTGAAAFFEASIPRLGTWNADQIYNTVRLSGCVVDTNGVRLAGASISADGIDYSGTSSARSDANGNFTLPLRRSGVAAVVGLSEGRVTNTVRFGAFDADTTVSDCLSIGRSGAGVSMKLTWGAAPSDLDSRLFAPDGTQVFFNSKGSLVSAPFANLDVDDTTQFGPEVVTLTRLMVGTYDYAVNNYSGQDRGTIGASSARVELNLPGRSVELFVPPTSGESVSTDWWLLFRLVVAADCTITLQRQGVFSTTSPLRATPSAPVYCTPS